MKHVLLVLLLVLNTACGAIEGLSEECGGEHEDFCQFILGGKQHEEQQESDSELKQLIQFLLQQNSAILQQIAVLELYGPQITALQTLVNQNNQSIIELQSNHNITAIVDPCGDGPGFDEVLFRTSTGLLIASFSQNSSGLNTRFAVIPAGNYATTDGTGCVFSVTSGGIVTPSVEL